MSKGSVGHSRAGSRQYLGRFVVRGHWAGLLSLPARWRDTTCEVWSQLQCRRSYVSKSLIEKSGLPLIVKGMFQVLPSSPRPRAADVCVATRLSRRYKARHGMPFHICGVTATVSSESHVSKKRRVFRERPSTDWAASALITASATLCPFSLPHDSPRRTDGGWRYLDRVQYRSKHGARLLPEKPLRRPSPTGLFPLPLLDSPDGLPSRYALSFGHKTPRVHPYPLNVGSRPSGRRHDRGRNINGRFLI